MIPISYVNSYFASHQSGYRGRDQKRPDDVLLGEDRRGSSERERASNCRVAARSAIGDPELR